MPSEVGKGTRICTDNSTSLAKTGLVAKTTESTDSHPFNTSTSEGPPYSSSFRDSTSPKDVSLALVREHNTTKGICNHGEEETKSNIHVTSRSGLSFVIKGKLILFS